MLWMTMTMMRMIRMMIMTTTMLLMLTMVWGYNDNLDVDEDDDDDDHAIVQSFKLRKCIPQRMRSITFLGTASIGVPETDAATHVLITPT